MNITIHPPASDLISVQEVMAVSTLSRSAIHRAMKAGRFPASVQLTERRVAWRRSEVMAWVAAPLDWGDPVAF